MLLLHAMNQSIFRLQTFSRIKPAAMRDKHQPFFSCLPDAKVQLPLVLILPNTICAHTHIHMCTPAERSPHTHTHKHESFPTKPVCILTVQYGRSRCRQRIQISSSGLLGKRPPPNFISPGTKERPVTATLVKVPGHTDNILGMSRKLRRPIMASQLYFKRG